jgi:aminoglycoside phosphotransferase family enzyme/predicted kinase
MMVHPIMPTPDTPPLIHALLVDPACYDHGVGQVQLIETHISWVLLTGDFAYKIKKPVDMGFLDFSTLALRQQACDDEVRLNRRLAPDIYLAVVAITESSAAPRINGSGVAFEYAVKMRQFPPDATLDRLAERSELGLEQIDALAARLARFHLHECAIATPESPYGKPDAVLQPVADNFSILEDVHGDPLLKQKLTRLHDWSLAEHQRLAPLMRERKQQGSVRECHGDLHLGNMAWVDDSLVIFDCLEFSPALRWIDVISEVAFCFMDLLHRERRDLAFRFLNGWLEISGDYRGIALLRYYAVYRAMVRAKVAALRARQSGDGLAEVDRWLQMAEQLIQIPPLQLWITHGLSGCGKTTLSQAMLQKQGLVRLRSDIERKRLAGLTATSSSGSGIASGLYSPNTSRRTYDHLATLADGLLEAGWPVIVDAAFLSRWQRDLFRTLAQRRALSFHILDIQTAHATLRERIVRRAALGQDASEADLRVLDHQIATAEPLGQDELANTTIPVACV